jgi:RNA polymerase sigma factor (sigma-70 family)
MKNNAIKTKTVESWVELYSDALFSWAISKTKSKEVAEDLIQDTFIAALKSFETFENRSQPKTWLISILNNKIIDHFRKERKRFILYSEQNFFEQAELKILDRGDWVTYESVPDFELEKDLIWNEQFENVVLNCINELPEKWHLALTYKYFSSKRADEICQELEISNANYWQIIHRSKLLLKKRVEAKLNF